MPSSRLIVAIECTVSYVEERHAYGADADGRRGDVRTERVPTHVEVETGGLPIAVQEFVKLMAIDQFERQTNWMWAP